MSRSWLWIAVGWVLVIVGGLLAPLPWPFGFGAPLLFIGLYILATNSKWTRRGLQRLRERYPGVSAKLDGWKSSSIPQVRRFVKITRPQGLARLARMRKALTLRRRRSKETGAPPPGGVEGA